MAVTYDKIATTTLSSTTSIVNFSSIPLTYTDLVLVCSARGATNASLNIQFNNDTTGSYSYTVMDGNGTATQGNRQTNTSAIQLAAWSVGMGSTTNPSQVISNIMNYSSSTTFKTIVNRSSVVNASNAMAVDTFLGTWRNTSAITSITINGTGMSAGSTFTLYGIMKA